MTLTISLWQNPRSTLKLAWDHCVHTALETVKFYPLTSISGAAATAWVATDPYLSSVAWWVGLGVVASIGVGSGLQTGVLIVFPTIIRETTAYVGEGGGMLSFWEIYIRLLPRVLMWGLGTALGEIPPYYCARSLGIQFPGIDMMKTFINRYGAKAVVLMASYPNAAFDVCGIACGLLDMPLYQFLSATIVGKTLLKAPLQLAFFIVLAARGKLGFPLCSEAVGWIASKFPTENSVWSSLWSVVVWCMVGYFVARLVEQCASRRALRDKAE